MKAILLLPICLLFTLLACSRTQTAGSASVTTNGTVAGVVHDSTGLRLSGASATLVRVDQDPAKNGDSIHLLMQVTNARGEYLFESVPVGDYRLVVRNADSSLAATVNQVSVGENEELVLPVAELSTLGSLRISIVQATLRSGDRLYIPGSDVQHLVSSAEASSGLVELALIPQGTYDQLILVPAGSTLAIPLLSASFVIDDKMQTLTPDYESSVAKPLGFATVALVPDATWGGQGGDTITVSDTLTLRVALADNIPRVVLINQMISGNGTMTPVGSNKTILGIGDSVGLDSLGLSIRTDSNIVIRNLNFRRGAVDAVSIEESAKHIWVDHNTFDQYGDGLVDIKRASDYITVSWNHFRRHKSTSVIGHSDDNVAQDFGHLLITFHHNWYDHTENGNPRVRFGTVHLYNEFYDSIAGYAIASTQQAKVVVASCVFDHVETTSIIRHTSPLDGDLVGMGNLFVESGTLATHGMAFSPSAYYSITVDPAEQVRSKVMLGAGSGKLLSLAVR
jgi:pectate lyase